MPHCMVRHHRARAAADRAGLGNIEFIQGDAQVHPFPADSFDVTIRWKLPRLLC